jgi:hypothetical protein
LGLKRVGFWNEGDSKWMCDEYFLVMLFLAFTFRIQYFKPKSAILAGEIEQFGEEIFPLTSFEIKSILGKL